MTVYGILKEQFQKEIEELRKQLALANTRRKEAASHCSKVLVENDQLKGENSDLTSRLQRVLNCAQCTVINERLLPQIKEENKENNSTDENIHNTDKLHPTNLQECFEAYRQQILQKCKEIRECEERLLDRDSVINSQQAKIRELEIIASSLQEQLKNSVPFTPEMVDVKPALLSQLQNASQMIVAQNQELERLRQKVGASLDVENLALRTQLMQIQKEASATNTRVEMQDDLLAEMHYKIEKLQGEKAKLKDRYKELEAKYKKTKSEYRTLLAQLENELSPSFEGCKSSTDVDVVDEARLRHMRNSCEPGTETESGTQISISMLHRTLENLRCQVLAREREAETERKRADSLQDDLSAVRNMYLEKEALVVTLEQEKSHMDIRIQQVEEELSNLNSTLDEERGKSQQLLQSIEELETLLSSSREECMYFEVEINQLRDQLAQAEYQITVYDSKLDAQGRDLVETKKRLGRLERTSVTECRSRSDQRSSSRNDRSNSRAERDTVAFPHNLWLGSGCSVGGPSPSDVTGGCVGGPSPSDTVTRSPLQHTDYSTYYDGSQV